MGASTDGRPYALDFSIMPEIPVGSTPTTIAVSISHEGTARRACRRVGGRVSARVLCAICSAGVANALTFFAYGVSLIRHGLWGNVLALIPLSPAAGRVLWQVSTACISMNSKVGRIFISRRGRLARPAPTDRRYSRAGRRKGDVFSMAAIASRVPVMAGESVMPSRAAAVSGNVSGGLVRSKDEKNFSGGTAIRGLGILAMPFRGGPIGLEGRRRVRVSAIRSQNGATATALIYVAGKKAVFCGGQICRLSIDGHADGGYVACVITIAIPILKAVIANSWRGQEVPPPMFGRSAQVGVERRKGTCELMTCAKAPVCDTPKERPDAQTFAIRNGGHSLCLL